jgi:hypothetical protein
VIEQKLEWVETANPRRMAEEDAARGQHRFLSVCGYSCMVPGIGTVNAKRCYPSVAVEDIAGTGDVFFSDRQRALQQHAWELATDYNALVAASQRAAGQSTCLASENWDGALTELAKLVWSLSPGPSGQGHVTIPWDSSKFELSIPDGKSFDSISQAACAVLRANGLDGKATLRYRTVGSVEHPFREAPCSW